MATTQNNKDNVSVGKGVVGGYLFSAPAGTALPTDYTTALNAAFVNLGYVTDEGAVFATEADSNTFKDLNGDDIASSSGGRTRTLAVVLAETNVNSLKEVYGQDNVTEASGTITINHTNADMEHRVLVLELLLRNGRKWRRVIEDAQVTEWDDMTVLYSELVRYGITYTLNGDTPIHDYIQATTPTKSVKTTTDTKADK